MDNFVFLWPAASVSSAKAVATPKLGQAGVLESQKQPSKNIHQILSILSLPPGWEPALWATAEAARSPSRNQVRAQARLKGVTSQYRLVDRYFFAAIYQILSGS